MSDKIQGSSHPLAAKITSHNELLKAYAKANMSYPSTSVLTVPKGAGEVHLNQCTEDWWWLYREQSRELVGLYDEPTAVLRWIRAQGLAGQYFPHVSKGDDPTMVAYTPDATYGAADRQVRVTIGKFLRKFLLLLSDKEIARLEAMHRAEMDPTFLVARTPEEIERVYLNMQGDTGCMRHPRTKFGLTDYHPSAVYSGPGLGVAYLEQGGAIVARSVIYDNPDDAADKRYVRLYGAPHLGVKLKRAGYRLAGLAGVKLPKLVDSAFESCEKPTYVMPYVDAPGGGSSGTMDKYPYSAIAPAGEDYLLLLGNDEHKRLGKAGVHLGGIRTQAGYTEVREFDPAKFIKTCALTGKTASSLEVEFVWFFDEGFEAPVEATQSAVLGHTGGEVAQLHGWVTEDASTNILVPYGKRHSLALGSAGYSAYLANPLTIKNLDLCKLDAGLYPNDQQWCSTDGTVVLADGRRVLGKDTIKVLEQSEPGEVAETFHLASDEISLRKNGYVLCLSLDGMKCLANSNTPGLVKLTNRRMAVVGWHDIVKLWDGRWAARLSTSSVSVCKVNHRILVDESPTSVRLPSAMLSNQVMATADRLGFGDDGFDDDGFDAVRDRLIRRNIRFSLGDYQAFVIDADGTVFRANRYSTYDDEDFVKAARKVAQMDDAALDAMLGNLKAEAVCWADHANRLYDLYLAERMTWVANIAEGQALDYTDTSSPGSHAYVSAAAAEKVAAAAAQDDALLDLLAA